MWSAVVGRGRTPAVRGHSMAARRVAGSAMLAGSGGYATR